MTKKYKCLSCGNNFEADDNDIIECPHCRSNNVSVNVDKKKNFLYIGLAFLVSAIAGYFVSDLWINPKQNVDIPKGPTHIVKQDSTKTIAKKDTISVDSSNTDSIETEKSPTEEINTSNTDDRIEKKPNVKETNSDDEQIKQLDEPKQKDNSKLIKEIQGLINTKNSSIYSKVNGSKIHVSGNHADDPEVPTDISGVVQKLRMGIWESVTVTDVETNNKSKIISISLIPNYSE